MMKHFDGINHIDITERTCAKKQPIVCLLEGLENFVPFLAFFSMNGKYFSIF